MASKHILVVESNPDDALFLCRALKELPFCTAFLCRSLAEARAYLSRAGSFNDPENYPTPNAIITELRLGVDSGYELLIWMRGSENLQAIQLYILAGVISPQDRAILSGMGIKRIVEKPSSTEELKQVLRDMAAEVCSSCP